MNDWCKWRNENRVDEIPEEPGVYKIRLIGKKKESDIPRFIGKDKERIIMYGSSIHLRTRINNFIRAKENGRNNLHAEGERLYEINESVKREYKNCKIQFSWKIIKKHKEREEESELLKSYFRKFGELPPLNRRA